MNKKPSDNDESRYLIPLPEDVLDPDKRYTRTDVFVFGRNEKTDGEPVE